MSRESKIMQAGPWGAQSTVSHYESFGWELLSINGNQIAMSRETQDSVYSDLVKHQAAYEQKVLELSQLKRSQITPPKKPAPTSFKTALGLFILLIFPCVIYLVYKHKQKVEYDEGYAKYKSEVKSANEAYEQKRAQILSDIEKITSESRAIFFSPRG